MFIPSASGGKHVRWGVGRGSLVLGGEKTPGDSAGGWARRPVGGGWSAGLRTVHPRRTDEGGGPVGRPCGDEGGGRVLGGSWGAHGGPRWRRGMERLTTSPPCPHDGQGGAARRGGHPGSVACGAGAGAVGRGAAGGPARQRWSGGRRGRGRGLHTPSSRTWGQPGGHPGWRTRRMNASAGRGIVRQRRSWASWSRQRPRPAARARSRGWVRARRWTSRPRECRTCSAPCPGGVPSPPHPVVRTAAGRVRSGRS
jgi:hypothetical protein